LACAGSGDRDYLRVLRASAFPSSGATDRNQLRLVQIQGVETQRHRVHGEGEQARQMPSEPDREHSQKFGGYHDRQVRPLVAMPWTVAVGSSRTVSSRRCRGELGNAGVSSAASGSVTFWKTLPVKLFSESLRIRRPISSLPIAMPRVFAHCAATGGGRKRSRGALTAITCRRRGRPWRESPSLAVGVNGHAKRHHARNVHR